MLSRAEKSTQLERLSQGFSKSKAFFLVNCIGLKADETATLRKKLKQNQSKLQVIRNTLSLLAIQDQPELKKTFTPYLKGPNAFVLSFEDPTACAKILSEFTKEHEAFEIKAAVLDGKGLSKKEVAVLATLPSKEELRASLLGLLSAPMSQFLNLVGEPSRAFVRLLKAKK